MQCPICKKDLEIKNKKIGENEAGEAIYNEFAICRDCKKQWNLDKQREKKKKLAKEALAEKTVEAGKAAEKPHKKRPASEGEKTSAERPAQPKKKKKRPVSPENTEKRTASSANPEVPAYPDSHSGFLFQKNSKDRHEHDIKCCNKSGFSHRCVLYSDLLQVTCHTKCQSTTDSTQDDILFFFFPICFFLSFCSVIFRTPFVQKTDTWNQKNPTDQRAYTGKCKGPDIIHPHALCYKSCSPNKCRQKEHQCILSCHFLHRAVSYLPSS